MKGLVFGRLEVMEMAGNDRHMNLLWLCRCQCGKEKIIKGSSLRSGATQSCGCLRDQIARTIHVTHGHRRHTQKNATYTTWISMIQRCTNPNAMGWENYGGRGIKVCDRWLNSFEDFLADVGERPSTSHSIDRFPDNNKGYEPNNVRWATRKEQMNNRRNCRYLTHNGKTQTIQQWRRELGLGRGVIDGRLKAGRPIHEVLAQTRYTGGNFR